MANETITTDFFQLHFPHLEKPQPAQKPGDIEKHAIRMAFMKDGLLPASIAQGGTSSITAIQMALEKVCMEEWGVSFADAPVVRQIQNPPEFKDGDSDWKKDDKKNLIVGQAYESSMNKWMITAKNVSQPGFVDHTGTIPLDPKEFYMGCWCRAELTVSAYVNKAGYSVISITLNNIQKCYKGENLSGGVVQKSATEAFAGMAVANSDVEHAGVTSMTGVNVAPTASPVASQPTYIMQPSAGGTTREAMLALGWTDESMVQNGHMIIQQPTPPPVATAPTPPPVATAPTPPPVATAPTPPPVATAPTPPLPGQAYLAPGTPPPLPGQ